MNVICLEEKAFYALIDKVFDHIKERTIQQEKWIPGEEAMRKLNIKSKTTLQKLRNEGKIRYSQPQKKVILYDSDSINEYLEDNTHEPF